MNHTTRSLVLIAFLLAAFAVSHAGAIVTPTELYPRLDISPAKPAESDTVKLWLVKGMHGDGCVPSYTASYTIETLPQDIYPPNRIVHLSYTAKWPAPGTMCIQVLTEYGPHFTLPDIAVGSYTVKDGDNIAGTFQVNDAAIAPKGFSIKGTVVDDPSPLKRASLPVAGAKVYLRQQVMWLMDQTAQAEPVAPPYPTAIVDSAVTASDGSYSFVNIPANAYTMSFVAKGYVTRTISLSLLSDTTINMQLLVEGAAAVVAGNVYERPYCPPGLDCMAAIMPIEGCTVTVMTSECGSVYAPLPAAGPVIDDGSSSADLLAPVICPLYMGITDAQGAYKIENIPLTRNGVSVTVTARAPGYATESQQADIYNRRTTTVDFSLQKKFVSKDSAVVDGVVYSISTEKKVYNQREYVRAKYVVHNQSNKTVKFGGVGPGHLCTYSMTLTDQDSKKVYSTADNLACPAMYTEWSLKPGEKDSINFNPYFLGGDYTKLTVTGQMISKNNTKASVDIDILKLLVVSQRRSSHTALSHRLSYNTSASRLELTLDRPQNVHVAAYLLTGQKIQHMSAERHFARGTHSLSIDRNRISASMIIFRVNGSDFAEMIKLNLAK